MQLLLGFGKLDEVLLSDLVEQVEDSEEFLADEEGDDDILTDEEVQVSHVANAAIPQRPRCETRLPFLPSFCSTRQWKVLRTASLPSPWGGWEHGVS